MLEEISPVLFLVRHLDYRIFTKANENTRTKIIDIDQRKRLANEYRVGKYEFGK